MFFVVVVAFLQVGVVLKAQNHSHTKKRRYGCIPCSFLLLCNDGAHARTWPWSSYRQHEKLCQTTSREHHLQNPETQR